MTIKNLDKTIVSALKNSQKYSFFRQIVNKNMDQDKLECLMSKYDYDFDTMYGDNTILSAVIQHDILNDNLNTYYLNFIIENTDLMKKHENGLSDLDIVYMYIFIIKNKGLKFFKINTQNIEKTLLNVENFELELFTKIKNLLQDDSVDEFYSSILIPKFILRYFDSYYNNDRLQSKKNKISPKNLIDFGFYFLDNDKMFIMKNSNYELLISRFIQLLAKFISNKEILLSNNDIYYLTESLNKVYQPDNHYLYEVLYNIANAIVKNKKQLSKLCESPADLKLYKKTYIRILRIANRSKKNKSLLLKSINLLEYIHIYIKTNNKQRSKSKKLKMEDILKKGTI